jgi:hypothetical protein
LNQAPEFDKLYKTVVTYEINENYYHLLEWLDRNSIGKVDIKLVQTKSMIAFIGFEHSDDALIFKIRYST